MTITQNTKSLDTTDAHAHLCEHFPRFLAEHEIFEALSACERAPWLCREVVDYADCGACEGQGCASCLYVRCEAHEERA